MWWIVESDSKSWEQKIISYTRTRFEVKTFSRIANNRRYKELLKEHFMGNKRLDVFVVNEDACELDIWFERCEEEDDDIVVVRIGRGTRWSE
ncbi:hypothetical protein AKJ16_DCAP18776 [Drosera capensis]